MGPVLYRPDTGEIRILVAPDAEDYNSDRLDNESDKEWTQRWRVAYEKWPATRKRTLEAAEEQLAEEGVLQYAIANSERCVPVQTADPVGDAMRALAKGTRR